MVNVDVARLYCRVFETKRWVGGLCVAFNVAGFAPLKISGTILNHFSLFLHDKTSNVTFHLNPFRQLIIYDITALTCLQN